MKGSFKTALIAAVVSAFVAAGAAVATTQTFRLGTSNAPDAQTPVVAANVDGLGGIDAPMFRFTNSSTGGSATPLSLSAGAGRPPLTVNSHVLVSNLNADWLDGFSSAYFLPKVGTAADSNKLGGHLPTYYLPATGKAADANRLDGIDSTLFVRGRGTFLANRIVFSPTATKTLLLIPGFGYLSAKCTAGRAYMLFVNGVTGVDAWWNTDNKDFSFTHMGLGQTTKVADSAIVERGATIALGDGSDPGARRTAVLEVFLFFDVNTGSCTFQAQGMLWESP